MKSTRTSRPRRRRRRRRSTELRTFFLQQRVSSQPPFRSFIVRAVVRNDRYT